MSTARRRTSTARASVRASRVLIAIAIALWLPKNASAALFGKRLERTPTSARASDELAALRAALRDASDATRALARAMDAALSAAAALEEGTGAAANSRAGRGTGEASVSDGETCARDARGACAGDLVAAGAMSLGTTEDLEDRLRRATEERVRAVLSEVASASAVSKFGASFHRVSTGAATSRVSTAHPLPFRRGRQRVTEYYATGDVLGDVTVRNAETGETECESKTTTSSPVRAMTAYMLSMNTSVVITGHEDGTVAFTAIERARRDDGLASSEHVLSCSLVASITAAEANAKYKSKLHAPKRSDAPSDKSALEHVGEDVPIETLGIYRIMGRRFITAADANGRVTVFLPALNDFANVHGVFNTGSKVFAFRPYKNAVVALTQRGVTYADINAFTSKLLPCEGLLRFDIAQAAFDPNFHSKLIGVTTDGRLFTGSVSLDGPRTGCSVVVGREESDALVAVSGIAILKSYAVVARSGGLEIINTTNTRVAKRVSHASNRAMLAEVGTQARSAMTDESAPVVSSNGDNQIIVIQPEEGIIMIFDSNLYLAPPPSLFGESPWFQPLAMMIALGVAIWSYKNKRSDVLDYTSESERRRTTQSALRKLGYGEDIARARARVAGEERDDDDDDDKWTPAKIRQEIHAARINGDL